MRNPQSQDVADRLWASYQLICRASAIVSATLRLPCFADTPADADEGIEETATLLEMCAEILGELNEASDALEVAFKTYSAACCEIAPKEEAYTAASIAAAVGGDAAQVACRAQCEGWNIIRHDQTSGPLYWSRGLPAMVRAQIAIKEAAT